jgi:predicted O-methyltransferase YrrM
MISEKEARYIHDLAVETHKSGALIDIGIYRGGSTCCLATAAKAWGGKVVAIDSHQHFERPLGGKFDVNEQTLFLRNIEELELEDHIDYRREPSLSVCSKWSGEIDFISIDGNHRKEELLQDLNSWKHFVRIGGVVVINKAQDGGRVDQAIDASLYRDPKFMEIQGVGRIRGFTKRPDKMEMILCCGLQSGGTTLVSWCFLQRPDMSGILDMWTEGLQLMPYVSTPYGWCKMTVSCFRWQDVADFYLDQGWIVRPLLVVRDVRTAYASLRLKPYGINGITGQDPPLRLRFKRFLRDWEDFRAEDLPIIRYESLVAEPEKTLKRCCEQLAIPWYEDMLLWPKSASKIGGLEESNTTFRNSLTGQNFEECVIPLNKKNDTRGISKEDLIWLEKTFGEYNDANRYPEHVHQDDTAIFPDRPCYRVTQHVQMTKQITILNQKLANCKLQITNLLESKSWKLTEPLRKTHDLLKRLSGR